MSNWSFDILRQGGWDLWVLVCAVATLVLATYAVAGTPWRRPGGWISLGLVAVGVLGTLIVLLWPALHDARVGIVWTFTLLSILSAAFYLNLLTQLGSGKVIGLLAMRITALGLAILMFFEPILRRTTVLKPEKPIVFLIDTSGSMSFPDEQNGPTRLQKVWQTLRPEIKKLNDHFLPRYFTFDTDLRELKNPDDLAKMVADGKATDIATAIAKATNKETRKDANFILISDGIDNTSSNVAEAMGNSDRPLHALLVGSDQAEPATLANVAVDNVEAPDDFMVGHESKIKVTIKSTALANRVVDVKLSDVDDTGKPKGDITTQKLVLQPLPQGQPVELPYKPRSIGVHKMAVWIDPIPGERSLADNRQDFQGLADDPKIKVLYMETARPEYKPVKKAMEADGNVEVATYLRITTTKFEAGGKNSGDPFTQLPTTLDEWKKFDVIIIGDLDAAFFNRAQQTALEQLVSGGAGLMMLGGEHTFGPGNYQNTSIEKILPVFVGDASSPQEKTLFVPRLTAEGATHPAMEGLSDWFGVDDRPGTKQLPPLRGNVVVPRAKTGAEILLTHLDRPGPDGKPQIVLATERYGQGRSAAFTVDTTYLWSLPLKGLGQKSPYESFWGQMVRWLAGEDVRKRQTAAGIDAMINKSIYQLGESVRVRARVRDQRGDVTEFAQVAMVVKKAGDKQPASQKPLTPVSSTKGLYDTVIETPEKGDYVIALVASKDGKELGKSQLKFTVIPPADEMLKLAANPGLLEQIAGKNKEGSYRDLPKLGELLDKLISAQKNIATVKTETVKMGNTLSSILAFTGHNPEWADKFDLPMQGGLVFVLLVMEWMLRRRWQLP